MKKLLDAVAKDLWVVVLDVVIVNLSYYLALLVRFYINFQFRPIAEDRYLPAWLGFAPWYTVICIIVFMCWRLYGGLWRYAGINDMNRIIGANLCTTFVQVVGSWMFFTRMPVTYYFIGALLQFMMVVMIRFSYRVLLVEKKKMKRRERVDCIVIGSGDLGRRVINHLEDGGAYRVVAVVGLEAGRMMNGIPVISISSLAQYVKEKRIPSLFIADPLLSVESRDKIKTISEEQKELEIADYTGYSVNSSGNIPLTALMSIISGPVTVVKEGRKKTYDSPEAVMKDITEKMDVKKVKAPEIELGKAKESRWSVWAEEFSATTGQDASIL